MVVNNDTIQESIGDVKSILDSAPTPRRLFMSSKRIIPSANHVPIDYCKRLEPPVRATLASIA